MFWRSRLPSFILGKWETDDLFVFFLFFKVDNLQEYIYGEAEPQLHRVLSALKLNELNYGISDENAFK